jgi:hypothetical protein
MDQDPGLADLARRARYTGNPAHKRNPGDYGLDPPAQPRAGATLCDGAGINRRRDAENLLHEGLRRGLVSEKERNGWPQNVWAVTDSGVALEACLENQETGEYHGYPMLVDEPLAEIVLRRWRLKDGRNEDGRDREDPGRRL